MRRYFYDLEFLEDGETIAPMSIGIAAEDGREYYAVNATVIAEELDRIRRHPWLMSNVVPHLPKLARDVIAGQEPTSRLLGADQADIKPHWKIAGEVSDFIRDGGGERRSENELWAYYGAYDHVALCQFYGRMVDLPPWIPMHTNDLKSFGDELNQQHGTIVLQPEKGAEHHALADARWDLAYWRRLVNARDAPIVADRRVTAKLVKLWQELARHTVWSDGALEGTFVIDEASHARLVELVDAVTPEERAELGW